MRPPRQGSNDSKPAEIGYARRNLHDMECSTSHPRRTSSEDGSFEWVLDGSFELFNRFVEHLIAANVSAAGQGASTETLVDWELIRASIVGSCSVEHAIGRATVIADR